MRSSPEYSSEDSKSSILNGNGTQSSGATSRLDNSLIFGSYRSASIDHLNDTAKGHRSLFRTTSLPEIGAGSDRKEQKEPAGDSPGTRFERLSILLNSSTGSLTGAEDPSALKGRLTPLHISSPPSNSPTRVLSPTGSIDLHRPFTSTESPLSAFGHMGMGAASSPLGTPMLHRSLSNEGTAAYNGAHGGSHVQRSETERNLAAKYRAFPDAYVSIITVSRGPIGPLLTICTFTWGNLLQRYIPLSSVVLGVSRTYRHIVRTNKQQVGLQSVSRRTSQLSCHLIVVISAWCY